jgi:hypothetical protein
MNHTLAPLLSSQIGMLDGQPIYSFFGAERGINTAGDVLVNSTADGVDLNEVWATFTATLKIYNEQRSALASLLSYATTRKIDAVPQSIGGVQFEEASEFGLSKSARLPNDVIKLGYGFRDWDVTTRMTWMFLRDADLRQVAAVHDSVLEGDNRLTTTAVLERLFDPAPSVSPEGNPIYGLWNADGMFVPGYMGQTFDAATETHYLTTGSAVLDPSDLETLITKVTDKGFSSDSGRQLVILANPLEAKVIATFRAGEPGADGVEAHFDYVPSAAAPARLVLEQVVGDQAPAEFNGLPVLGSYGDALVIQSHFIPKGYVSVVASAGPNAEGNVVGYRVHENVAYQGLRLIPGGDMRYPIVSSTYATGFGVGVRHRGGAACLQVTTNAVYAKPTLPK